MDERSDEALARAWASGDLSAGDQLLRRYSGIILRFFRNKVAARDLDDLAQKVLEGCVRGIQRFREDAKFSTYLIQIAHNVLVSHYRKQSSRGKVFNDHELVQHSVEELRPGLVTMMVAGEQQQLLLAGLRRLPLETQILLELYYYENKAAPELSEILDIPLGTVRSRLRRAKAKLQEIIREVGAEPTLTESTINDLDGWARRVRNQMG